MSKVNVESQREVWLAKITDIISHLQMARMVDKERAAHMLQAARRLVSLATMLDVGVEPAGDRRLLDHFADVHFRKLTAEDIRILRTVDCADLCRYLLIKDTSDVGYIEFISRLDAWTAEHVRKKAKVYRLHVKQRVWRKFNVRGEKQLAELLCRREYELADGPPDYI